MFMEIRIALTIIVIIVEVLILLGQYDYMSDAKRFVIIAAIAMDATTLVLISVGQYQTPLYDAVRMANFAITVTWMYLIYKEEQS